MTTVVGCRGGGGVEEKRVDSIPGWLCCVWIARIWPSQALALVLTVALSQETRKLKQLRGT